MRKLLTACAAGAALVTIALPSVAHIKVTNPPVRYEFVGENGNNQKTGPCGEGQATGIVTAFNGGDSLTVSWNETINHPGHFRLALDTDDDANDDFADPTSENDMDVSGNVVAYVPDNGGSAFEYTFNLPDIDCDNCTLQIMQVMTEKLPWGPENGDDLYFWCADISITASAGTGGAGGAAAASSSSSASAGVGGGDATGGAGGADDPSTTTGSNPTPVFQEEEGCTLSGSPQGDGTAGWLVFAGLLALATRRRRQHD